MISGLNMHRLAVGALLAATLGLTASATSVATERAVPSTTIQPSSLANGAAPKVPWLDGRRERIMLPGRQPISTVRARTPHGGRPSLLIHARGGYLLDLPVYTPATAGGVKQIGSRLNFVSDMGRTRTVIARSQFFPVLASSDGGTAVLRGSRSNALRAVRVSNGKVLGTFEEGSYRVTLSVKAAGPRHILLQVVRPRGSATATVEVVRWDPTTGTSDVIDRRTATRKDLISGVTAAASTEAGRYATYVGDHSVMVDARTGSTLWRSAAGEVPLAFSPDNRRVVTVAGYHRADASVYGSRVRTVRVRDAVTGRLQATFTGNVQVGWPDRQPMWESRGSLLMYARDSGGQRLVRCEVGSGRCSRVATRATSPYAHLVVRTSS